jgi:hypothetical protein
VRVGGSGPRVQQERVRGGLHGFDPHPQRDGMDVLHGRQHHPAAEPVQLDAPPEGGGTGLFSTSRPWCRQLSWCSFCRSLYALALMFPPKLSSHTWTRAGWQAADEAALHTPHRSERKPNHGLSLTSDQYNILTPRRCVLMVRRWGPISLSIVITTRRSEALRGGQGSSRRDGGGGEAAISKTAG